VTPATVPTGSPAFTLQVNGSGFVTSSVVYWNKSQLTTTFVSSQQLQAAVPATLAATGGHNTIMVANPDGQSTSTSGPQVAIQNPVPAITKLSPSSAVAGSASLEVVVTGTGFLPGSVAAFSGAPRVTTVESATQLTVTLTAADLTTAKQAIVTVTNSAPGGGVSSAVAFSVTPGPPTITAITPDSITAPAAATQITILGSGFTPQSVVVMQQLFFTPDSVTANKILVTLPSYFLLAPAVIDVRVLSSGIFSNTLELTLLNPLPVSTLAQEGNFNASGLVVPDSTHGVAYFLGTTASQSGGDYTLQIFDLKTYTLLKSIVLGSIVGFPNQMIRWGSSGIAFITEDGGYLGQEAPGMIYILSGDALVVTGSEPGAATEEHVQFTWRSQLHKKR
jgi:hypothetical protein